MARRRKVLTKRRRSALRKFFARIGADIANDIRRGVEHAKTERATAGERRATAEAHARAVTTYDLGELWAGIHEEAAPAVTVKRVAYKGKNVRTLMDDPRADAQLNKLGAQYQTAAGRARVVELKRVGLCGAPTKDKTPCLNTRKGCPHHRRL